MQRMIPGLGLVVGCAALLACDPEIKSEEGQLVFHDPFSPRFTSGDRVLAGSRYCPSVAAWFDAETLTREGAPSRHEWDEPGEGDDPFDSCFTAAVEGPATLEDGCIEFADAGGEVIWELAASPCTLDDEERSFVDDRLRFTLVPGARAAVDGFLAERELIADDLVFQPEEGFPKGFLDTGPAPYQVYGAALLDVTFFDADGERLAWTDHGVHVGVEGAAALGDALEGLGEDDGAALLGSGLIVSAQPGAAFSAFAAVRARRYPLGGFAGVGEEAVASLDVVPLFEPVEVDGEVVAGRPLGIRAIARDDQQRPIYGAPVRWEVIEGRLGFSGVEVDDDGAPAQPEGERIYPNDACEPPPLRPQRRSATLVATVGGERARVELEWTALPPAEDEGYAEDPTCQGPGVAYGCVCAAGSRGGGEPLAALFLLALVRGRRRVGRRR